MSDYKRRSDDKYLILINKNIEDVKNGVEKNSKELWKKVDDNTEGRITNSVNIEHLANAVKKTSKNIDRLIWGVIIVIGIEVLVAIILKVFGVI